MSGYPANWRGVIIMNHQNESIFTVLDSILALCGQVVVVRTRT